MTKFRAFVFESSPKKASKAEAEPKGKPKVRQAEQPKVSKATNAKRVASLTKTTAKRIRLFYERTYDEKTTSHHHSCAF